MRNLFHHRIQSTLSWLQKPAGMRCVHKQTYSLWWFRINHQKKKKGKKKPLSAPRPGEMGFPKGPPPPCPLPRLAPAPCTSTACTHSNLHWERPRCPPTHGNDSQKPRSCTLSTTASRMFDQNLTRIYITQKYRGVSHYWTVHLHQVRTPLDLSLI